MDWSELIYRFLPAIIREIIIVFGSLGVVYLFGRLLFPQLDKKTRQANKVKNRIAAVALFVITFGTGAIYDYPELATGTIVRTDLIRYLWESGLYCFFGVVFYVTIGWRFYARMDRLLDRKFANDEKSDD